MLRSPAVAGAWILPDEPGYAPPPLLPLVTEPLPGWLVPEDPTEAEVPVTAENVGFTNVGALGAGTDGALTEGVEAEGVETEGVETEGVDPTGVETDGTLTDGTDTDGTDTDGVLRARLGIAWMPLIAPARRPTAASARGRITKTLKTLSSRRLVITSAVSG